MHIICVKKRSFPERPHHTLIGFGAMGVSQSATLSWFLRSKKKMETSYASFENTVWNIFLAMNPGPGEKSEKTLLKWTNLLQNCQIFFVEIVRLRLQENGLLAFFFAAYLSSKHSMLRETMNVINMGMAGRRCGLGIAGLESDGKPEFPHQFWNRMPWKFVVVHDFLRSRISSKTLTFLFETTELCIWFLRGKINFQLLELSIFFDRNSACIVSCADFAPSLLAARLEWQKNWMQLLADFWWRKLGVMGRL